MISGDWALAFNLLTVGVLAFIVGNILVSLIFWKIKDKLKDYAISSRKSFLWLFVLTPWFVAFSIMLFFSPLVQAGSGFVWLTGLAHWHHPNVFYFLSWHSFSLVIFIVFGCYIFTRKMMVLYKNTDQVKLLRSLGTKENEQVYIIDSPIPTAFTSGLIKPSSFISTGLIEQMSAEDIEIITQHELAHAHYSDPLKKWLFSFFAAYYVNNIRHFLISMMSLSMEQDADSFCVKNQQSPQNVATTLIKFTKLAAKYTTKAQYKNELFVHFSLYSVEQRTMHLLNLKQFKTFPIGTVLVTILLLALISATSVDGLHHVIETLFTH